MPSHAVARALLAAAGVPVGAPSANTFTRPSATTAAHVLEDLDGRVDLILDAGPAAIGLESTVLDLTTGDATVLRPGGVPLEALRSVLPGVTLAPRYLDAETDASSPGQMLKHYSPRAEVLLVTGSDADALARMREMARQLSAEGRRVGFLVAAEDVAGLEGGVIEPLGSRDDLEGVSRRLFAALRDLDRRDVDVILARDFGRGGLGAALWDRLLRAAEGRVLGDAP
jgi:L-threonylcarbamoyladenylate synthase